MNKELIERMRAVGEAITQLADTLARGDLVEPGKATENLPQKTYTFEEARAILAGKARAGFRAEVKAILTAAGAKALSDLKDDPQKLADVVAEAEKLAGESDG